jgi:hypothetical protein
VRFTNQIFTLELNPRRGNSKGPIEVRLKTLQGSLTFAPYWIGALIKLLKTVQLVLNVFEKTDDVYGYKTPTQGVPKFCLNLTQTGWEHDEELLVRQLSSHDLTRKENLEIVDILLNSEEFISEYDITKVLHCIQEFKTLIHLKYRKNYPSQPILDDISKLESLVILQTMLEHSRFLKK